MKLQVDDDELAACVACGLCLPHCPTFRVSGEESRSPRGRIAAMRAIHSGAVAPDDDFVDIIDECVQCRGCEPACPSGVPFGRLMEGTRETLSREVPGYLPAWKRQALLLLGNHRLVLAASSGLAMAQRAGAVPARLGLPRLPVRRPRLRATGTDVYLFTGCVMDAWQRPTHLAVQRVLGATGVGVALPGARPGCCGALASHAGAAAEGQALAERTLATMPGDTPILVDSAGCGAALKAADPTGRVLDVHEWLAERLDRLPAPRRGWERPVVAVQDPCHLRHVQKAHSAVRRVLQPYTELVELDDEGLCCGAGGAYSFQQPELSGAIRQRKLQSIARSGAPVVASANPGCAMHLSAAGLSVRHPLEIVEEAIGGG